MPYLGGEDSVVYWTPLFIIVIDVHVYLDGICCEYIISPIPFLLAAIFFPGHPYIGSTTVLPDIIIIILNSL